MVVKKRRMVQKNKVYLPGKPLRSLATESKRENVLNMLTFLPLFITPCLRVEILEKTIYYDS